MEEQAKAADGLPEIMVMVEPWVSVGRKLWAGELDGLHGLLWLLLVPLAKAVLVLTICYLSAQYLSKWLAAPIYRRVDRTLGCFVEKLVYRGTIGIAVLLVLNYFGIQATSFAAVLAAMGFAIGLAFQGTLANFASGFLLMVFRPFKVGDMVMASGVTGRVSEVDLFTTIVDTPDNRRLIIPNSAISGHTIENMTYHPVRRLEIPIGIAYSADMDATREALWQAMNAASDSLVQLDERQPQVALVGFGASTVDWKVTAWVATDGLGEARDRLVYCMKKELDRRQIPIAFPQLDVHLDGFASAIPSLPDSPERRVPRRHRPSVSDAA
jgi:small conductance mechanosensitive channel